MSGNEILGAAVIGVLFLVMVAVWALWLWWGGDR